MKKYCYLLGILFLFTAVPLDLGHAQKTESQVSVTYPGDTDETINRRRQWIEGARKEGMLTWWGVLVGDSGGNIIAEFNKIYPFIRVAYWRGSGTEIASKLEAEYAAGRFAADVVLGGNPYNYPRWRKMGILGKYIETISSIKSMDRRMHGKHDDWASVGFTPSVPTFNTNLLSARNAPKKWEDILDPKWKGQIGIPMDVKTWTVLAIEEGGWGLERTEEFLKRLKEQGPIRTRSKSTGQSLLIAGEFKVFSDGYIPMTLKAQTQGAPIEWCRISPVVVTGSSFVLSQNAPHPNAAKLFLEWLFTPQGLQAYEMITYHGAVFPGSGTRLAKALEGLSLVFRTEEGEIKGVDMGIGDRFDSILSDTSMR